jgi:cytochrome c-type biogenesis protein CcmH/NrfF
MTGLDDEPSREDAAYATVFAFLRRYGWWIALIAPFVLISLVPMWGAPVLFLVPGAVFTLLVVLTRFSGTNLRAVYRTGIVPAT